MKRTAITLALFALTVTLAAGLFARKHVRIAYADDHHLATLYWYDPALVPKANNGGWICEPCAERYAANYTVPPRVDHVSERVYPKSATGKEIQ